MTVEIRAREAQAAASALESARPALLSATSELHSLAAQLDSVLPPGNADVADVRQQLVPVLENLDQLLANSAENLQTLAGNTARAIVPAILGVDADGARQIGRIRAR
jgi:hypothetical protein